MGQESEALQDWHIGFQAEEEYRIQKQEMYFKKLSEMEARYKDNLNSQIGTTIRCACCGKRILKSNYQTQFCRNKGAGNCKDKYWNNVPDKRRFRAQAVKFARG